MFGAEKNEEDKRKERERRQRGVRRYGQARTKQARGGAVSCSCAGIALLIYGACIAWAYMTRGEAPDIIGGIIVIPLMFAVYGERAAWKGLDERDRRYLLCGLGMLLNLAVVGIFAAIYIGGLGG